MHSADYVEFHRIRSHFDEQLINEDATLTCKGAISLGIMIASLCGVRIALIATCATVMSV